MSTTEKASWWEQRTRTEKYSFVAVTIMALIIALLIIGLACHKTGHCQLQQEGQYCVTSGCLQAADAILQSLDETLDPCDDFYEFVCGKTINKTVIPDDKQLVDQFGIIGDTIQAQLHTILQEGTTQDDIEPIQLVKKYYQACMNEVSVENLGQEIVTDLLRKLGGWPVLDEDLWNEDDFYWTKLMGKFRRSGLGTAYFIEAVVFPDLRNTSIRLIELDQPPSFSRLLSTSDLINRKHTDTLFDLMVNISVQLGANRSRAADELNQSLEFEIKLAKIVLPPEKRTNRTLLHNPMTIDELQKNYTTIPWLEYLNGVIAIKTSLKDNDRVSVVAPSYLSALEDLLKQTPKRVQANYALWRMLEDLSSYLPNSIYKHFLNAAHLIGDTTERPLRWKECLWEVNGRLSLLVSSQYVRKYFDEDAKNSATEMATYLKNEFKQILKDADWMDHSTLQKALEKADKIKALIGYPDELLNDKLLESHYETLKIKEDEYLQSYLNIQIHNADFNDNRLRELVNKTDWVKYGNVANLQATYSPLTNNIFFPAGILQGTFFNKNRPQYMNFGGIGFVIGHEITHAFDNTGRQYDANANLINWWTSSTEKSFLTKAQCFGAQYGNYTIPEINLNINGIRTVDENIADNGGIKEAYFAYSSWLKKHGGKDRRLPGLDHYSYNQLFWISSAMNWCARYKPQMLKVLVELDDHPINRFRILGAFMNSPQFSQDFSCSVASRMNPVHKCAVW